MRRYFALLLAFFLVLVQLPANASSPKIAATGSSLAPSSMPTDTVSANPTQAQVDEALHSSSPLFIENVGQFAEGARFQLWGGLPTTWLAEDAIWITVVEQKDESILPRPESGEGQGEGQPRKVVNLKLSFVGANPHPRLEPYARLETVVSYFIGADPASWRPDVPVWGGVRYVDLYPGIDLLIGKDAGWGNPPSPRIGRGPG